MNAFEEHQSKLQIAAVLGIDRLVEYILLHDNPIALGRSGDEALIEVSMLGYTNIAQILLKHGVDVNTRKITRSTPLQHAVGAENEAMVQFLLNLGADPNVRYSENMSALAPARNRDQENIIRILEGVSKDLPYS